MYVVALRTKCAVAAMLLLVASAGRAQAYDVDYDAVNNLVEITLDDSHDLLRIYVEGNRAYVDVLMFDADVYSEVPNVFEFSDAALRKMASEEHEFSRRVEDLLLIRISCLGGHDVVLTQLTFPVSLIIIGGEGDDHLDGGAAVDDIGGGDGDDILRGGGDNDFLSGGNGDGDDDLYGEDGDDFVDGGPGRDRCYGGAGSDVLLGDYDDVQDILQGDAGPDLFYQFYRVQRTVTGVWTSQPATSTSSRLSNPNITPVTRVTPILQPVPRLNEELLVDVTAEDTVRSIDYASILE